MAGVVDNKAKSLITNKSIFLNCLNNDFIIGKQIFCLTQKQLCIPSLSIKPKYDLKAKYKYLKNISKNNCF